MKRGLKAFLCVKHFRNRNYLNFSCWKIKDIAQNKTFFVRKFRGKSLSLFELAKNWIHLGIFVFRGGSWNFFKVALNAFISIRMTLGTIHNDYFDYMRHVWDIFGTIRPPKIIFSDYIFKNFWKWMKIRFLAYCDFIKAITTF